MTKLLILTFLLAFSSCAKEVCEDHVGCEIGNVVLINHTLVSIQTTDDQGNPLQTIPPLGFTSAYGPIRLDNGAMYGGRPGCNCTVHHEW